MTLKCFLENLKIGDYIKKCTLRIFAMLDLCYFNSEQFTNKNFITRTYYYTCTFTQNLNFIANELW